MHTHTHTSWLILVISSKFLTPFPCSTTIHKHEAAPTFQKSTRGTCSHNLSIYYYYDLRVLARLSSLTHDCCNISRWESCDSISLYVKLGMLVRKLLNMRKKGTEYTADEVEEDLNSSTDSDTEGLDSTSSPTYILSLSQIWFHISTTSLFLSH